MQQTFFETKGKIMNRTYTVSKTKEEGLWYAHKKGFSYIPCMVDGFNTFSKTKRQAQKVAACMMGLSIKDYLTLK